MSYVHQSFEVAINDGVSRPVAGVIDLLETCFDSSQSQKRHVSSLSRDLQSFILT